MSQWSKVDVGLQEATTDKNHYDADGLGRSGNDELESTDPPGIFYSLEVIHDYKVFSGSISSEVKKAASPKKSQEEVKVERPAKVAVVDSTGDTVAAETKRKRKRKRKKAPKQGQIASEPQVDEELEEQATALQMRWMQATHGVELPLELCRRMLSFENPTPIQAAVLPASILGHSNIVGAAPTGSGKTLAFLLPILYPLWNKFVGNDTEAQPQNDGMQALILTPTRELAKQIYREAAKLSQSRNWVGCFTGGLALVKQERVLEQKPQVVVGTPGRLWELIQSGHYEHVKNFASLRFLVLDEADRMMSTSNSFPELHKILEVVDRTGTDKRRTLLFSATLTMLGKGTKNIMEKTHATGPTKVVDLSQLQPKKKDKDKNIPSSFQLPPGLKLLQIQCTQMHKDSHLYAYLMMQQSSALVFCNSISAVRRVGQTLRTLGWSVRILHAHMPQRARFQAVESLDSKNTIVIATDVAARGLDWTAIPTVVHYDAARTVEAFVHRAGRTARGVGGGAVGSSLSLIAPSEDKSHHKLIQKLNLKFDKAIIDGRILREAQERVCLASKVSAADDDDRKRQRDQQWFKEHAEEAGLEVDEDLLDELADNRTSDKRGMAHKSEVTSAKRRLEQLLSEPLQIQRHGKFLRTRSVVECNLATPTAEVPSKPTTNKKKRRRGK